MAPSVLITGAAGNLGSLLARHLLRGGRPLRLMYHRRSIAADLLAAGQVTAVRADLSDPSTLPAAVDGVDAIVHFAGVLFAPRPERFLPRTNTQFFANLVRAAREAGVARVVLISFPHVEGPTSVEHPATGRLDRVPISVHAKTRLEEERLLLDDRGQSALTPIVLRCAAVYGRGILMVDAAEWLARRRLLCVWKEPTLYQLISSVDFARACEAAIDAPHARGIYHAGDERPITLQEFLDAACKVWGCPLPRRLPFGMIYLGAAACEAFALVARTTSPLTRDFVRLGRVPHWGDTRRFREELLPELEYPTLEAGLALLARHG
jgi:nucleoside-diphosphate-sugar epimerase